MDCIFVDDSSLVAECASSQECFEYQTIQRGCTTDY